ncbi:hypothetical protein F0562_001674 [Nyssa sinensis]|uniref:Uncharacterized protein n=1 Tax=Nyssa sinensis TaxID=561372 RepID=A0A5J5C496_9ASTE|nr:hypothetical protein F0562_001674 [Nyssa sinensis]
MICPILRCHWLIKASWSTFGIVKPNVPITLQNKDNIPLGDIAKESEEIGLPPPIVKRLQERKKTAGRSSSAEGVQLVASAKRVKTSSCFHEALVETTRLSHEVLTEAVMIGTASAVAATLLVFPTRTSQGKVGEDIVPDDNVFSEQAVPANISAAPTHVDDA